MDDYTVIINVLNGAKWIAQALEQVNMQSFQPSEIIVLDNNSTDDLKLKVIANMPLCRSRIQLHSLPSTVSLYQARNIAWGLVKTRYVCYLDVDDLWIPTKCEDQLFFLSCSDRIVHALTSDYYIQKGGESLPTSDMTFKCQRDTSRDRFNKYSTHFSSVMLDKLAINDDSPFNPHLTILGDLLFFLLRPSDVCHTIHKPLSVWRHHGENTGYRHFYKLSYESLIVASVLLRSGKPFLAISIIWTFWGKVCLSYLSRVKRSLLKYLQT